MKDEEWKIFRRSVRGFILEKAITLEKYMSDFIEEFFFNDKEKGEIFRSYFLNKEWFNFGKKLTIFIKLLKSISLITQEEIRYLEKNISECEDIRNRFAHIHISSSTNSETTIGFSFNEEEIIENEENHHNPDFILEYLDNGKNKKEIINKEKFKEYYTLFNDTKEKIKEVLTKLRSKN